MWEEIFQRILKIIFFFDDIPRPALSCISGPRFSKFLPLAKKKELLKKICYLKSSFHFHTSIKVSTISKMSLFLATGVWKNLLAFCLLNSLNFWGLISWRERGFISKSKAAYLPKKTNFVWIKMYSLDFFQFLRIWNYLKYSQQVSHSLPFTYPGFIMQWLNILPVVIPKRLLSVSLSIYHCVTD